MFNIANETKKISDFKRICSRCEPHHVTKIFKIFKMSCILQFTIFLIDSCLNLHLIIIPNGTNSNEKKTLGKIFALHLVGILLKCCWVWRHFQLNCHYIYAALHFCSSERIFHSVIYSFVPFFCRKLNDFQQ